MAGYTTLVAAKTTLGSIANWLNRSDLPVTEILTEAQAFIYEHLRVREMMTAEDIAVASDNYKASLPTGFLDPVKLTPYGWGGPLWYVNEDEFKPQRETDGTRIEASEPQFWTVIGTELWFDIQLDAAFGGTLIYYKTPTALSGANNTNFLTTRYPTVLRHACESFGLEHMKQPDVALSRRQLVEAEIADINMTNELYRRGQY
jgi:hypothetical protein